MKIAADVGGFPDSYPIRYEVQPLKDGTALKLTDARGCTAEIVLTADDARLLGLAIFGALPPQPIMGLLGDTETSPATGDPQ